MAARTITDEERRCRLAVRHAVAPWSRAATPEEATRSVVVLHATEPATVHLSLAARVDGLERHAVDRVLYEERSLVRQLAMRRTLFVLPRDLLPAAWGSASSRVGTAETKRVAKDAVAAGFATDGEAWLREACGAVTTLLAGCPDGLTAVDLRGSLPRYSRRVDLASSQMSLARVLTVLGCRAEIVRGVNTSHWRVSRPRWTRMSDWLGEVPEPLAARAGYAELVRRWLGRFGPGTLEDVVWWLGATKGSVAVALEDVGAVEVALEGGLAAYVLPDDVDDPEHGVTPEPWAALLPVLDPTVMGWKGRDFYLGPHAPEIVDRNGNAGSTAWWNGRVVGCWVTDNDATVVTHLLEKVEPAGRRALAVEAERLTTWLAGERVGTVYPSTAMKRARADLETTTGRAGR